nr:unnamed protein product [Digitaria exilis]
MPPEKMLPFASQVAGIKCRAIGARVGLPWRPERNASDQAPRSTTQARKQPPPAPAADMPSRRKVPVHVRIVARGESPTPNQLCIFFLPPANETASFLTWSGCSSAVSMASGSGSGSGSAAPGVDVADAPAAMAAVTVEPRPPAARLSELGVRYALSYGARQTCYVVRGRVSATVEGSPERAIQFGAGDLVVFARGTRCTWHIAAAVDMHYAFDPS